MKHAMPISELTQMIWALLGNFRKVMLGSGQNVIILKKKLKINSITAMLVNGMLVQMTSFMTTWTCTIGQIKTGATLPGTTTHGTVNHGTLILEVEADPWTTTLGMT